MDFAPAHDAVGNDVIFAAGNINRETFERFKNFLRSHKVGPGTVVAFHSNGGDAATAFRLGDYIRSQRFQTIVAQQHVEPASSSGTEEGSGRLIDPGECASACTFTFMGGIYREVPPGSRYVIHAAGLGAPNRNGFTTNTEATNEYKSGFFQGQVFAGYVVEYLLRMGVSSEFLVKYRQYDSREGREYAVPQDVLREWNVVNVDVATEWSLSIQHHRLHHRLALVGLNHDSAFAPAPLAAEGPQTLSSERKAAVEGRYRREEVAFRCERPRQVTMEVAYLPSPAEAKGLAETDGEVVYLPGPSRSGGAAAGLARQYELATSSTHVRSVIQTGKEEAISLVAVDPADIIEPFHVSRPDSRIRGTIAVTPRLLRLLASSPRVVEFGFRDAGRFYGFPVDFHAIRKTFFNFVAACSLD